MYRQSKKKTRPCFQGFSLPQALSLGVQKGQEHGRILSLHPLNFSKAAQCSMASEISQEAAQPLHLQQSIILAYSRFWRWGNKLVRREIESLVIVHAKHIGVIHLLKLLFPFTPVCFFVFISPRWGPHFSSVSWPYSNVSFTDRLDFLIVQCWGVRVGLWKVNWSHSNWLIG